MRYSLSTIRSIVLEGCSLQVRGKGGTLAIRFYSTSIVFFRYDFDGLEVPAVQEKAFGELKGFPETDGHLRLCLTRGDAIAEVVAKDGVHTLSVKVEMEEGNLSVSYDGRLVSGGALGSLDTVIPRIQVRAFKNDGERHWFARCNFPATPGDRYFGLGDKGGKPDRNGRRFRVYNRDSLGFDAEESDPLYKSVPFFLKQNPARQVVAGYYFPETLVNAFDFGEESPFYTYVEVEGGPIAYYLFTGDTYKHILFSYCQVTGFPALPPLFSFGFFGSSMNYVEADDAMERILRYFETIERHHIPCEGMYLSSGYLKADDGSRYAFFWNKRKFPDCDRFLRQLAGRGYNLTMNIKPGILTTHPWYEELKRKGFFLKDKQGNPLVEFYWGGQASFIDFSNPQAQRWWKEQLKTTYLVHGCTGIWNDNNECELEDPESDPYKVRALFPVHMAKAAAEAFDEFDPVHRHWIYSRSGYAGLQKYARTWTGDNTSTWKTLKFNQYQCLSLGLSGLPFYGNDLGGFYGERPSEELLLRSCQSGVFQPRFVIHSWRADDKPTEPWTYPNALPAIKACIEDHYRFMPYTYSAAWQAATAGIPIDRALCLEYPEDPDVPTDSMAVQYGDGILKLLVVEQGSDEVRAYLPKGTRWYDPVEQALLAGGRYHTFRVPLYGSARYLLKEGSVVPTAPGTRSLQNGRFRHVDFWLQPGDVSVSYRYFEDDGSTKLERGAYTVLAVRLDAKRVTFTLEQGTLPIEGRRFTATLPEGFLFDGTGKRNQELRLETMPLSLSFHGSY